MELNNYGFIEVGECKTKNSLKSKVAFEIHNLKEKRVVYAFVVDDKAKYIGICAKPKITLKDRMGRYQSMTGDSTNERIAGEIKKCLKRGKAVKIFALKPESSLLRKGFYKGLKVDLVKGLENPLFESLDLKWNIQK